MSHFYSRRESSKKRECIYFEFAKWSDFYGLNDNDIIVPNPEKYAKVGYRFPLPYLEYHKDFFCRFRVKPKYKKQKIKQRKCPHCI